MEFCSRFLVFLIVLFFDFFVHVVFSSHFPRIDIFFIFLKFFSNLSGIFSLFIAGILSDIVYITPVGTTSITYMVLFLLLHAELKEGSELYFNMILRLLKKLCTILFFVVAIRWCMFSIFFKELLFMNKIIEESLYSLVFYILIYYVIMKVIKRRILII